MYSHSSSITDSGQAEARNLRANHAARLGVGIEYDAVVAERREIARDGERGGAAAHQRDPFAVPVLGRARQARLDVAFVVRGDALEPADRNRLVLDAAAPAGGLARPVAGAAENAGKHVGLPIEHVGVAVTPCRDQSDVFRNGGVRRTGPLAIDDLVEIVRGRNVGGFHSLLVLQTRRPRPAR
jgi:hypothetical protein